jgi:hypothetical protein
MSYYASVKSHYTISSVDLPHNPRLSDIDEAGRPRHGNPTQYDWADFS